MTADIIEAALTQAIANTMDPDEAAEFAQILKEYLLYYKPVEGGDDK